jgi:hypothetical protein
MIRFHSVARFVTVIGTLGHSVACAGSQSAEDRETGGALISGPSSAERLALWERQSPGEPIPAAVTFTRELTFEEVEGFLARHGLRPFAVHVLL